jgi:hypothetical protein
MNFGSFFTSPIERFIRSGKDRPVAVGLADIGTPIPALPEYRGAVSFKEGGTGVEDAYVVIVNKADGTYAALPLLTPTAADALFLTPTEADALFLTPAEGDAAYVNASGDTINGQLIVSQTAANVLHVTRANGTQVANISTDPTNEGFRLWGGAKLILLSGVTSGQVFSVDGANGNTVTSGSLGVSGSATIGGTLDVTGQITENGVGLYNTTEIGTLLSARLLNSSDTMSGDLTVNGLLDAAGGLIASGGIKVYASPLNAGIVTPNASTTVFEDAVSLTPTLPAGTWTVHVFWWGTYSNTTANNGVRQRIVHDPGTNVSAASAHTSTPAGGHITLLSQQTLTGRTVAQTIRGTYRAEVGGSVDARNQLLVAVAIRTA